MAHTNVMKVSKILSKNDTGETGGHQAGILVPKKEQLLNFFPRLDGTVKNPRITLNFIDDFNICWQFNYIYYNNKFFGGTRDEYRLTCMTPYIKKYKLSEGDTVTFSREQDDYTISCKVIDCDDTQGQDEHIIKLSDKWRVIKI